MLHCHYLPNEITYIDGYQQLLDTLQWKQEEVFVFNKLHQLDRRACRYGENNSNGYSGVGVKRHPIQEWPDILVKLLKLMNDITKERFPNAPDYNFVLGNYYPTGDAYIGYHNDDESDYKTNACIGSLSFGSTRDFTIKDKNKKVIKIPLNNGDVFIMEPGFQQLYKHSIPKRKNAKGRINLTFRSFK